jgi:ADP-ribose pyrophosphatase YjhB (NUDIX family)
VAGLIERADSWLLIARADAEEDAPRVWQFPRGPARAGEWPEAAMRRFARTELGVRVEIVVGQPPLIEQVDGARVELRYFFCEILDGDPLVGPYAEIRWVSKLHLREYEFDAPSQIVVDWLLEAK